MENVTVSLTEGELGTIISGLLFSCSVNIVSSTNKEYQTTLFELAKKLKYYSPALALKDIQFVQEEYYEDSLTENILREFIENMEVVSFKEIL